MLTPTIKPRIGDHHYQCPKTGIYDQWKVMPDGSRLLVCSGCGHTHETHPPKA